MQKIVLRTCLLLSLIAIQGRVESSDGGSSIENQPYQLDVCLRFAENPLFTKQFRQSIERQVADQLGGVLGPLVNLQVYGSDTEHWLLKDRNGRQWHEADNEQQTQWLAEHPGEKKICHVYIDSKQGRYRTHLQFLDQRYQWIGPVQVEKSADRQWLARKVIQSIYMGLPINVIVEKSEKSGALLVKHQGEQWIDRVREKMAKSPVYGLYRVVEQKDGSEIREPVADTYLVIGSAEKEREPLLVSRYSDPMKRSATGRMRVIRFEALNLPTRKGRITLTVLDREMKRPAVGCQVFITNPNSEESGAKDVYGTPDASGKVPESEAMSHIAVIKVQQGEEQAKRPVAITEPLVQYVVYVDADPQVANRNRVTRAIAQMRRELSSLTAFIHHEDRRLAALVREKKYEEACETDTMSKKVFLDSFYPIQQAFKKLDVSGLNEEEKKAHEKLRVRVLKMSRTVNKRNRKDEYCQMRDKANNVNRAQLETRMGDAALERLDVDTALSHFQTALTIMDKHPYFDKDDTNTLRERYQTIREQWRIKDVLHGNIRKQVCQQLPESELREAVRSIAKIKKNLKHLVKQDDVWTLKKLHREIEERIDEVNDAIMISKETKDVAEAKEYKEWMEQLDKSYEEIGKLINKMGDGDADEEPDDEEPDDEEPDDAEPDDAEPDDEEPDDEEPDDEDA